jgi:hypothetical protein
MLLRVGLDMIAAPPMYRGKILLGSYAGKDLIRIRSLRYRISSLQMVLRLRRDRPPTLQRWIAPGEWDEWDFWDKWDL